MKELSAIDVPNFKALDGSELLDVLVDHLSHAIRTVLLNADNHFHAAKAYPVAQINAVVRIGLYHDPRSDAPYKVADVPITFTTLTRTDDATLGSNLILREDVRVSFAVGRDIASAPDKLREEHGLELTAPVKGEAGIVSDVVVTPARDRSVQQ